MKASVRKKATEKKEPKPKPKSNYNAAEDIKVDRVLNDILSIAMAIFGLCMFSYNGKTSQFVYLLGKYSFLCFFWVGGIGAMLLLISKVRFK